MGVVFVKRLVHETRAGVGLLQGVQAKRISASSLLVQAAQDHAQRPNHVQADMGAARAFGRAAPGSNTGWLSDMNIRRVFW